MKTILPIIILVAAVAGITIYSQNDKQTINNEDLMVKNDEVMEKEDNIMEKSDDSMMMEDDKMMDEDHGDTAMKKEDDKMMMEDESETMAGAGAYLNYENTTIANLEGTIVLSFYAPWCPTCRSLEGNIEENMNDIPSNLTIVKVDYDSETALKKKYGVTRQHTLVQVDQQGNKIALWTGGNTLASVVAKIQ